MMEGCLLVGVREIIDFLIRNLDLLGGVVDTGLELRGWLDAGKNEYQKFEEREML